MDKFEEKKITKKRIFAKNTWFDWLINYIPKPIQKVCVKNKILNLFKTSTTKDCSKPKHDGKKSGKLNNEREAIKDRIIRDIKTLFEQQEEDYYKSVRVGNFYSNNFIEYESNSDRNKTLLIKEYLDQIKPYLKEIINNLRKSDTLKIQLTIAINSISSKDSDEERIMYSNIENTEIMIYDKADEVIKEPFE